MSLSVTGLVSGLDTSQLIDQLVQVDKQQQVNLQNRKTAVQSSLDVYRTLNTRMQAVLTAAQGLNTAGGWKSATATSSNDSVASVTASATATSGTLSFRVTALPRNHVLLSSTTTTDPSTAAQVTGPIQISNAAGTTTITDVGDGSLNAVAAAINASAANVSAGVVQIANGSYVLQLSSRTTGAASAFTVTGLDSLGPFSVLSAGQDAAITVGDPTGVHYDATSANGVFTQLVNGASITAKSIGDATITVAPDPGTLADAVQQLVTAVNGAVGYVNAQSAYDATNKKAGPLLGDLAASRLSQSLTSAVFDAVGSVGLTARGVGITSNDDGTLAFDRDAFIAAWRSGPAKVQSLFTKNTSDPTTPGIAERLRVAAQQATDVVSGSITLAISSRNDQIATLTNAISDWDTRLEQRRDVLKAQFDAMEVTLSSLKNQSSWLAGQIAGLGR